jgi:large subunit ribosomal protein L25
MIQSDHEAFYSSILTLKIGGASQQVVIKDMQRHPVRPVILHVDFLRISEGENLVMNIPVHFTNQDTCPAVKSGGGTIVHYINHVEVVCLPKDLPEYITVDMQEVALGQTVHLGELKLPEGVRINSIARGGDTMLPVVFIEPPRIVEEKPAAVAAKGKAKGGKK